MKNNQNTYDQIISYENIVKGYYDIIKKFDEDQKSRKYFGIDGVKINDINYISEKLLKQIQEEMISLSEITPPYLIKIPKKNGEYRNIYGYPIKERIKAEAIYRILEPIFDNYLSPYVYSYRKSHPYYFATRSITRKYKREYGHNNILIADLSNYTDSMNHDILISQLSLINKIDEKTKDLISLFICSKKMDEGLIKNNDQGLMTGTPLSGLLSNFFMDDFDKWVGKYADFYRRVGDDMIVIDKDIKKIEKIYEHLIQVAKIKKLVINKNKVKIIKDTAPFNFLGYHFENKKISLDESSVKKIISDWKSKLKRYPGKNIMRKKNHFILTFFSEKNKISDQFDQIIKQKILANDDAQIKKLSDKFYKMLTSYFYGHYTERNRRKLSILLKNYKIKSLYEHYYKIHYPIKYEK